MTFSFDRNCLTYAPDQELVDARPGNLSRDAVLRNAGTNIPARLLRDEAAHRGSPHCGGIPSLRQRQQLYPDGEGTAVRAHRGRTRRRASRGAGGAGLDTALEAVPPAGAQGGNGSLSPLSESQRDAEDAS